MADHEPELKMGFAASMNDQAGIFLDGPSLELSEITSGPEGTTVAISISATGASPPIEYRFVDLSEERLVNIVAYFRKLETTCSIIKPSTRQPTPSPSSAPYPEPSNCPKDAQ
jgi:hypothetical protein